MAPLLSSVVEEIGFGWAQIKLTLLGGGVWAADGSELLLLGSITSAVKVEWNLSPFEKGFVVSIVFLGVLVGNALSGHLGDLYGRRVPIVVSYLGVFVGSILSLGAWSFMSLAVLRFIVGISFGVGQPAWNTLGSEVSPDRCRLVTNALSQGLFSIGEIYAAALIYIDDPVMKDLHWRWLIGMGAIPSILLLFLCYVLLPESPFFLAINDKKDEAREVLKTFARANGRPEIQTDFQVPANRRGSIGGGWWEKMTMIFGPHLFFSTVVVAFSTFNLNFLFYGGLYAFPQVLPEMKLPVYPATNLLIGALSELPGFVIGVFVGTYYKRKMTMTLFCIGMITSLCLFTIGAMVTPRLIPVIQVGYILSKIVLCVGFIVVYVYCTEIYPTACRTTGSSVCLASGRIGALVCPIAYEVLTVWTGSFTTFFLVMIALCAINMILFMLLPYETAGKALPDDLAATVLLTRSSSDEMEKAL